MSGVYFDAVLDERMQPLFNGTPEETEEWLEENRDTLDDTVMVCPGKTMKPLTVGQYLNIWRARG